MLYTIHLTQCDESGWWVAEVAPLGVVAQCPSKSGAAKEADEVARQRLPEVELALVEGLAVEAIR